MSVACEVRTRREHIQLGYGGQLTETLANEPQRAIHINKQRMLGSRQVLVRGGERKAGQCWATTSMAMPGGHSLSFVCTQLQPLRRPTSPCELSLRSRPANKARLTRESMTSRPAARATGSLWRASVAVERTDWRVGEGVQLWHSPCLGGSRAALGGLQDLSWCAWYGNDWAGTRRRLRVGV